MFSVFCSLSSLWQVRIISNSIDKTIFISANHQKEETELDHQNPGNNLFKDLTKRNAQIETCCGSGSGFGGGNGNPLGNLFGRFGNLFGRRKRRRPSSTTPPSGGNGIISQMWNIKTHSNVCQF